MVRTRCYDVVTRLCIPFRYFTSAKLDPALYSSFSTCSTHLPTIPLNLHLVLSPHLFSHHMPMPPSSFSLMSLYDIGIGFCSSVGKIFFGVLFGTEGVGFTHNPFQTDGSVAFNVRNIYRLSGFPQAPALVLTASLVKKYNHYIQISFGESSLALQNLILSLIFACLSSLRCGFELKISCIFQVILLRYNA